MPVWTAYWIRCSGRLFTIPLRSDNILYASEIAFMADDVLAMAAQLKELAGVGQYRAGDE